MGRAGRADRTDSAIADLSINNAVLVDALDVLLLGPGRRSLEDPMCASCFAAGVGDSWNVIFVTFTQSSDDRLEVLRNHFGRLPDHVRVVSVVDRADSSIRYDDGPTVGVQVVGDPSDLTKIGINISRAAKELAETDTGETILCVHSLSAMLQYADLRRVFRFVHVLQSQHQGPRHYHMTADVHDQQTLATLLPLFDRVIEYDADGGVTIN